MLFHPTFIMIFFIAILLVINKHSKLFKFVSLVGPVVSSIFLILGQGEYSYELYNLKLIWEFDDFSKLIGIAFLLVLLTSNSYALGQKKYSELIIGFAYGASIFISFLAKDFISMFVGLELMMIMSSMLIFAGGSPKSSIKYFLTHLVSSNMIFIGIAHIMSKGNSSEIILVTNLIGNPEYSNIILYIMFVGMIINIAAFPFSGWMVNYYKGASASGSLYLINFTTKLSIILLIKVFAGFELLKYIGLMMIIYAGFKAMFEDNIFALLCYLSIISGGIMVLGIASGDKSALLAMSCYLFIHIIYKSLLSIASATLRDAANITLCSELGNIKNKILLIAIVTGVALMINIPFSLSFYSKLEISHLFSGSFFYIVILLSGIVTTVSLPWKECLKQPKIIRLELDFYNKLSIVLMSFVAFIIGFAGFLMPISPLFGSHEVNYYIYEILKQLGIFSIAAIIILNVDIKRKAGKALNILEEIGSGFAQCYKYWKNYDGQKLGKEKWHLGILERQMLKKISIFHNQSTAIFVAFSLLIIMLATLLISLY